MGTILWRPYYGDQISIIETTLWRRNFGDLILWKLYYKNLIMETIYIYIYHGDLIMETYYYGDLYIIYIFDHIESI